MLILHIAPPNSHVSVTSAISAEGNNTRITVKSATAKFTINM